MKTIIGLVLILAAMAAAPTALAAAIYTYTGNNFTSIPRNDDPPAGTYTTDMGVSGSFTVADPLPIGGLAPIGPSILSYSFNDGRNTLTQANSVLRAFDIAIDGNGDVTEWRFTIEQPFSTFAVGDLRLTILSQKVTGSNSDEGGEIDYCLVTGCSSQGIDWGRAFNNPGTWSVVPLPAAGYLFFTALLSGLTWSRRATRRA